MEYKQARSVISRFANQIKWLSICVFVLLFCNMLFAILLWHESNQKDIVLVPANLKESATISSHGVSASYLESFAVMLINDRLNITPDNVSDSNNRLLNFVDPAYYSSFKKQLVLDSQSISDGKISSTFYINAIHVMPKTMMVEIDGKLNRWVGERSIGSEDKRYQLQFSITGYQLLLTAFQELTSKGESV